MLPRNLLTPAFVGLSLAGLSLTACQKTEEPKLISQGEIKYVTVTGVGEVEVMPDRFVISGAVIKQDDDLTNAMNDLSEMVNAAEEKLEAIGGLDVSGFNFAAVNTTGVKDPECLLANQEADRFNQTRRENEERIKHKICKDVTHQASLSFTYTGAPVDKAGHAISALTEAGALRVNLNGFKVSDIENLELEAAARAIDNAREKADRLAESGGAKIKGVKNLAAYQPTYQYGGANAPIVATGGSGETTRLLTHTSEPIAVAPMNLRPGPQVVSASIQLEFIYE